MHEAPPRGGIERGRPKARGSGRCWDRIQVITLHRNDAGRRGGKEGKGKETSHGAPRAGEAVRRADGPGSPLPSRTPPGHTPAPPGAVRHACHHRRP